MIKRRIVVPWTLLLPIVGLLALATLVLGESFISAWAVHRQLNSLAAAQQPIDEATLRATFFASTSQSRTVDHIEWEQAYQFLSGPESYIELWPQVNGNSHPLGQPLVPAGEPWPERVLFEHVINQRSVILAELSRLAESLSGKGAAEPTWRFRTFSRQSFRSPLEGWNQWETLLIDAEFLLAYHAGDSDRAMRALLMLEASITANDWQVTIAEDLDRIVADHHLAVRMLQSLETPQFWTADQLDRLELLLEPRVGLAERWRKVLSGERAMSLGVLDTESSWFFAGIPPLPGRQPNLVETAWVPHAMLHRFLLHLNNFLALADAGHDGLVARSTQAAFYSPNDLQGWIPLEPLRRRSPINVDPMYALMPAVELYAKYLVDLENVRRLARLAIALRRYANAQEQWPQQLSQLESFGLDTSDLRSVDGGEFSMRVDPVGTLRVTCDRQVMSPLPIELVMTLD